MQKKALGPAAFNCLRGIAIGASMLVPGVSGGTMAIILGIYEQLVAAVSGIHRHFWRSISLLGVVAVGGTAGAVCFSRLILGLIQAYRIPTLCLFIGAVAGGIPLLLYKAQARRLRPEFVLYVLVGLFCAMLLGRIPPNLFCPELSGAGSVFLLAGAGLMLSVALVLPGISASYLLLVLGLYEPVLQALTGRDLPFLAVLGAGVLLGVLCTTRVLELAMTLHPQPTYLIILGFVVCAMGDVFPGLPTGVEIPWSVVSFSAGFASVFLLSRKFASP